MWELTGLVVVIIFLFLIKNVLDNIHRLLIRNNEFLCNSNADFEEVKSKLYDIKDVLDAIRFSK